VFLGHHKNDEEQSFGSFLLQKEGDAFGFDFVSYEEIVLSSG
jgi:hypothetical protein